MITLKLRNLIPQNSQASYRVTIGVFFFVMGLSFASWASRIPDIKLALGLNDAQLGSALFAAPLGQLPSMLFAGLLVNRFGSRKVLAVSLLLYTGALVFLGLASSLQQLFGGLFLFGVAGNLYNNSVNTQAVGVEKLYGRSIMGALHGLWSLGGVAGAVLGGVLAAFAISPLLNFVAVFSLAVLLMLFLIGKTLPPNLAKISPAPKHKEVLADDETPNAKSNLKPYLLLFLLGLVAFASMATEGTMYDWNSVYFVSVVEAPTSLVRVGYISCMCAMVCTRFVLDRLITRFGAIVVLQASGVLMCSGMLLLIGFPQVLPASIGSAMCGCGMAGGVPIAFSMAGKNRLLSPSVAISIVSATSFCGFLLCPPIIGYIANAFNLRWAFLPIVGISAFMIILSPLLAKQLKKIG